MSDTNETLTPAVDTAPESENTATPESVDNGTPEDAEHPKTFTQAELDAKIGERVAKAQRKWERDAQKQAAEARQVPVAAPDPRQFTTQAAYDEAMIDHKVDQKIAQRESQKQQNDGLLAFREREEEALTKYPDYQDVAYGEGSRVTAEMAHVIIASEIGSEIMYHLGQNRDEARRIAKLDPLQQAREIGKIEAKLTATPPVKKTSSAPDPINPVGSRSSTSTYSTSDPRWKGSTEEWIAQRDREEMKRLQG